MILIYGGNIFSQVTGQWLEGVSPSYQLILSTPSRVKVQLKGPADDSAMSLQLAAIQERKVVKLIAPKKRDTSPSELVKLITSKVNPGKVLKTVSTLSSLGSPIGRHIVFEPSLLV